MPSKNDEIANNDALNKDVEEIFTQLNTCLKGYIAKLDNINNYSFAKEEQLLSEIHEFLYSLAAVAPNCKRLVADLESKGNLNNIVLLKSLLKTLHNDKNLRKDILNMQRIAKQNINTSNENYSAAQKAALAEKRDMTEKLHSARISSALYDPVRYLGDLVEILFREHYMAPMYDKYYPKAAHNYNGNTENDYIQHLRNRYGNDPIIKPPFGK